MKIWTQKSQNEIKNRVLGALNTNVSYLDQSVLGVPGSFLDNKVFNRDAPFLEDAPFLKTLLENPNHIGCHTLETSEPFFEGTQAIEKELLDICAVDILKGKQGGYDGYVASGGTEANIQAIWIYRNFYQTEFAAKNNEIVIICSEDTHYSIDKAANLLSITIEKIAVNGNSRAIKSSSLKHALEDSKAKGKKYFIVICNMMTTMFGSVDDIATISQALEQEALEYKIHVDGAYGGFYYPFADNQSSLTFQNPRISSFTLDAHKMAQSPYGTGIFLIRKNLIHCANTKASYVKGEDYTLIGSRSGANAVAVWMILSKHGPKGWTEKVNKLQKRTFWLSQKLGAMGIEYFRNPFSNIITIQNQFIDSQISQKYWLVPDNHIQPKWQKIVVMEHVTQNILSQFIEDLGG